MFTVVLRRGYNKCLRSAPSVNPLDALVSKSSHPTLETGLFTMLGSTRWLSNGFSSGMAIVQWYRRAPNGYPVNDAKHWFNHNVRVYSPLQTTLPTAERYNLTSHGYAQCYNVLLPLTTYYNALQRSSRLCVRIYASGLHHCKQRLSPSLETARRTAIVG